MDPDANDIQAHLSAAVEAARRHDARTFVLEIARSHALDGITRGLIVGWPGLELGVIEAAVADAADALYNKVSEQGVVVTSSGGYLWGAAQNILRKHRRDGAIETVPFVEGEHDPTYEPPDSPPEDLDDEERRRTAIQHARTLLSRLGGEVVIKVMTFILDCLEQGDVYIDNSMIADTLGLTLITVRRSKSRGFQRLAREARKEGFAVPEKFDSADEDDDLEEAKDEE